MGCNCNEEQTPCGQKPCVPIKDCSCPVKDLSTDCVLYTGDDLECSGIKKGTILTDLIQQLDAFICDVKAELIRMFTIVNIGSGARWFKGVDALARKVFRTAVSTSPIITIAESTDGNEVEFGIDETELTDFVQTNQKTYSVENIGEGIGVYKDETVVGNNTQFNLRKIKSSTLSVMLSDDEESLEIETPSTASIPALYVNNLYTPTESEFLAGNTKGEGTLAKPFTDTVTAYVAGVPTITPNTAIQNALNAFVGAGTRLSPDKVGQQIIVQNNNAFYTFTGDFEYTNLNLKIEGFVGCTTAGYLINMDNSLNIATPSIISIEVSLNRQLEIFGEGFKNNGTTVATTNYVNRRQIRLIGEGVISFTGNDINKYLLSSDKDSVGNTTIGFNNDGDWQFEVGCFLVSEFQGLVAIGGISQVLSLEGTFQTGTIFSDVDVNLKAFNLKGGALRVRRGATIVYYGSNLTSRLKLFTLEPTNGFTPALELSDIIMAGNCETIFSKENNSNANINITSIGGAEANATEIFDSTNLWSVNFRDNYFSSGNIDPAKADLTQGNNVSSINTIGNNIVESLVVYDSKQSAKSASFPSNSVFLKRVTKTAGAFVVGQEYRIFTIGTTDYTLIGASSNTVGLYFTATGVGAGTGTAYIETREILI